MNAKEMNMKKVAILVGLVLIIGAGAHAETVLPTSNVLGDSANTASTLVYRDSNGDVNVTVQDNAIATAKLAAEAVTTAKIVFRTTSNLTSGKIICVPGGNLRRLGTCANSPIAGTCECE